MLRQWMELAARFIEALAISIMVGYIVLGTSRWLFHSIRGVEGAYERFRLVLASTLQIGLELLVAADIIRTVALDSTLRNLASLGALVLVRTLIGWTLAVEVEGKWPWQQANGDAPQAEVPVKVIPAAE
jgi:uncharacterized membrane protein